jgi:dihydroflavonol-4-reductase
VEVVTGGAGFIGTSLVAALRADGRDVRVVDLREPVTALRLGATWVHADVRDGERLRPAFDGAAVVYHLASVISVTGPMGGLVRSVNIDGTRTAAAAAAAAGVRRFLYCSSIHAYDLAASAGADVDESSPRCAGRGLPAYDDSKAAAEDVVRRAADRGLDAVIVNPTAVIGPQDEAPSRMGAVMLALWRRRLPALVAGGFDWVDVRDVVTGMRAAAERGRTGENYLLPGHRRSFPELARLARDCSGIAVASRAAPLWLAELYSPVATVIARRTGNAVLPTREALRPLRAFPVVNGARAAGELGYQPRAIEQTVADMYEYFQQTGALPRRPASARMPAGER